MSKRPVPPRGMRDLLPAEVLQRRHLAGRIVAVYERYGFQQIETPIVEDIERLVGSGGGENEKMLYKILKRRLDWPQQSEADVVDLGLRYDLTVPLARYYATHSDELLSPFKSIQMGSVFRAERPQKGRYRQFTQCDVDIIGERSVLAEVELIAATAEALQACDIGEFTIRLNDRRLLERLVFGSGYEPAQQGAVLIALDKVDKIGHAGVVAELQKIGNDAAAAKLGTVLEALIAVRGLDQVLQAVQGVDDGVVESLTAIAQGIGAALPSVSVEVDPTIVRGMGYYTGSIFEIEHADSTGSLAGGGRYDGMIGRLLGSDAPACGISIGFERLWNMLADRIATDGEMPRTVLLYDGDDVGSVMTAAARLRQDGHVVRCERAVKNRSAQLNRLGKAGFTHWTTLDAKSADPQPITTN